MRNFKTLYMSIITLLIISALSLYLYKNNSHSISIYTINDNDVLNKYSNGTFGDDELKTYFKNTVNYKLVSLSYGDISSINILSLYNTLNNKYNHTVEITLTDSGNKKIQALNKHGVNKITIIAFDSEYIGTSILKEEIKGAFILTSNAIAKDKHLIFFKKLSSRVKWVGL
ncbi:MAG: hypothetical protein HXX11_06725 [Desulfuromonadales bacterium]|nr:hypothetical protein [Desulfuromonadales bacterium]